MNVVQEVKTLALVFKVVSLLYAGAVIIWLSSVIGSGQNSDRSGSSERDDEEDL